MIGDAIYAWMKQDTDVTAIIGSGDDIRCYPMAAAQGKDFPRVTYTVVSEGAKQTLQGRSGAVGCLVQVDAWANGDSSQYATARALALAIHGIKGQWRKLDGFRGSIGGVFIFSCQMQPDKSDLPEPPDDGSDQWTYRVLMQFRITYNEA